MVGGRWMVVLEDFLSAQVLAAVGSGRRSLIREFTLLFLVLHSFTTSPFSNTTWHSKGLTEPSATPLSYYFCFVLEISN